MLKTICTILLFFCFAFKSIASPSAIKTDTLSSILKIEDQTAREKKLNFYILRYFESLPKDSLSGAKMNITNALFKYNITNKQAYKYFIESICEKRVLHISNAKNAMVTAIDFAGKNTDHYLLYSFLCQLAFIQIDEGNSIGAISSYGLAKKETEKMDDFYLQEIVDINISDIYYRNGFYKQSLLYLDQAEALSAKYQADNQRVKNAIYFNKCESFFRMNKPDSLKKYNEIFRNSKIRTDNLYTFTNRTNYYLHLLQKDYKGAIALINVLQEDTSYRFDDNDKNNLADAYFNNGQLDSSKKIINQLLAEPLQINHPEIRFHLYEVLGKIADKKNDREQAAINFKMALQQSEINNNRLNQVSNLSSRITIADIESVYIQKGIAYQKERLWLILAVVIALLVLAIITMFYRSIKQKRHYEKLLFAAKKEELAFINSHEVRKHLTNILGIVDVIKHSEDKEKEYSQMEGHLFCSAENLDKAIKNISEKLDN